MEERQYFDEPKKIVLRTPRQIHFRKMGIIRCHIAYKKSCHEKFDWLHLETLAKFKNLRQKEISESLEIKHLEIKIEFY